MRTLFCNIAWMKYYKGACAGDVPVNGGSYVVKNGRANEELNFAPVLSEDGSEWCYGSVETKHTSGKISNQLHIEKIEGCNLFDKEEAVEDVLVVFCAKPDRGTEKTWTCVVGWYKHATVFRNYRYTVLQDDTGSWERAYNILVKKEDVVLLPTALRVRRTLWWAPRANEQGFGFGQANVWFPVELTSNAEQYINKILDQINSYNDENWIDKYE